MATSTARSGLSREAYADAALDYIDAHGVESLSLRRLGGELGVHATAVYRYFRSKDELLEAALAQMFARESIEVPTSGTPRERIAGLLTALRRAFRTHPNMALPNLMMQDEQSSVQFVRTTLELLEEMGLQGRNLVVAYQMLETFTVGTNAYDWERFPEGLEARRRGRRLVGNAAMEDASRSLESMVDVVEQAFAASAEALLDAVERLAHLHP